MPAGVRMRLQSLLDEVNAAVSYPFCEWCLWEWTTPTKLDQILRVGWEWDFECHYFVYYTSERPYIHCVRIGRTLFVIPMDVAVDFWCKIEGCSRSCLHYRVIVGDTLGDPKIPNPDPPDR